MLKNPISRLSSNGSVFANLKQIKRIPEIVKLPLKLSLNEVFINAL